MKCEYCKGELPEDEPDCIACKYSPTDTGMYCYFGCPECVCTKEDSE